jgi:hypothetical protein
LQVLLPVNTSIRLITRVDATRKGAYRFPHTAVHKNSRPPLVSATPLPGWTPREEVLIRSAPGAPWSVHKPSEQRDRVFRLSKLSCIQQFVKNQYHPMPICRVVGRFQHMSVHYQSYRHLEQYIPQDANLIPLLWVLPSNFTSTRKIWRP